MWIRAAVDQPQRDPVTRKRCFGSWNVGRSNPHLNRGRKVLPMAKLKEDERPKGNKPLYLARARQGPENEYMQTIGAAWKFNEGDGLVVNLNFIPTDWDGKFLLVTPKDPE